MLFGSNLRKYRKGKGYTQEDLARLLDVSRQSVVAYENGRREPGLKMLIQIANVLSITTDKLLGRDEYSILNNTLKVRKHMLEIIGNKKLDAFCKDMAQKTGFVVSVEKMESYLSEKTMPDKIILKVMAMYAGHDVEVFYR